MSRIRIPVRSSFGRNFLALLCGVFPLLCNGQAFPSRPITMVYPYPAGSASDNGFRALVAEAATLIGQPIVYENRPGAAGRLGITALKNARPDGYVLSMLTDAIVIVQPLLDPGQRIEPGKDYLPVSLTSENYLAFFSHPSMPFRDVKGLIAYAKANPGKLSAGSSGTGTNGHLAIELLKAATGIEIVHVPYKGEAAAIPDFLTGRVPLFIGSTTVKPQVESGSIIGLATTGSQRWVMFPNLPTMQEAGLPDFEVSVFLGLAAPAGTPANVVAKINQAFNAALKSPRLLKVMQDNGQHAKGTSPEEFSARIKAGLVKWGAIIARAGIKLD